MNRTLRFSPALVLAIVIPLIVGCTSDHANAPTNGMTLFAPNQDLSASAQVPSFPTGVGSWVSGLSNPYLAFTVGRVFNFRSQTPEGLETTVVEVTHKTKTIEGVVTTVVHDQVSLDGFLIEDTYDWYAQDTDGNVWYFGEESEEIDHGAVVSTEGSWEAGVNGARPGIVMLANPKVGMKYQQEYAAGVAEDMASVKSLSGSAQVPFGSFDNCLVTFESTPLDKTDREYKYYVRGYGVVLTTEEKGNIREELVSIQH